MTTSKQRPRSGVYKAGLGFGSALAIAISWHAHQSILWAIIHGLFGWVYVVWFALTRNAT